MDPIKAICKRTHYPADKNSGTRPLSAIRWIVLHSTEGGTAESVARYFQSPNAGGSTHLVLDDGECYRCLNDNVVPWGAGGANTGGFHIEQAAYAKWTRTEWLLHRRMLERGAYKTALHCKKFGIPPIFRTAAGLKRNYKGVTTHVECSQAFGGTHWDPGKGWPRDLFMGLVKDYLKEM